MSRQKLRIATTLFLLVGCNDSDLENRAAAAEAEARRQAALREKSDALAADAQRNAAEAAALLNEIRAQGYPIYNFELFVTVWAVPMEGSQVPQVRSVVSPSMLVANDGTVWELGTTNREAPQIVPTANGEQEVTFRLEPKGVHSLIGGDIDDLGQISTLRTRFNIILRSMRLVPSTNDAMRLRAVINNITIFDTTEVGRPLVGNDFVSRDVSSLFAAVPSRYRKALAERVQHGVDR